MVRSAVAAYRARRRGGQSRAAERSLDDVDVWPAAQQPPRCRRTRPTARLVGTALDLLVRATLDSAPAVPAAALVGALRLEGTGIAGAAEVAAQVGASLRDLKPAQLTATADQWREVAILCALLARFEQSGRSLQATHWAAERLREVAPTLDAYAASGIVDELDVDDIAAAGPAIAYDHADLRSAKPLLTGQTFALSGALGGADADVIAGDLLLDFKSATTPRIVRGAGLWQVVGYALADTDDTYGVRNFGICACAGAGDGSSASTTRGALAGQTLAVSILRREFADLLT